MARLGRTLATGGLLLLLSSSAVAAQEPGLLSDLRPGATVADGSVGEPTGLGDLVVFRASDPVDGVELWISDGTPAGTALLQDIYPGARGSFPFELTATTSKVFFSAQDPVRGREFWVTDGTPEGTRLLGDLCPGICGQSSSDAIAPVGDGAVLAVLTGGFATRPWFSDGSAAGTRPLLEAGPGGDEPQELTAAGGKVFFTAVVDRADAGFDGRALWVTDGTPEGTQQLTDLVAGSPPSNARGLMARDEGVLFLANPGGRGLELWASDGTPAGTRLQVQLDLDSLHPGVSASVTVGGETTFVTVEPLAGDPPGRQLGRLWVTDGTGLGTRLVANLTALAGTPDDPFRFLTYPQRLVAAGGKVYFLFGTFSTGRELWVTDGTPEGTHLVRELEPGPFGALLGSLTELAGQLYFLGVDGAAPSPGLWTSDGTAAGTREIFRMAGVLTNFFFDDAMGVVGDRLYFSGKTADGASELWSSDGTAAGTRSITGFGTAFLSSDPQEFLAHRDRVFFTATNDRSIGNLWVTDGTAEGTLDLTESPRGFLRYRNLTAAGRFVYFERDAPSGGLEELWRTDGSREGLRRVAAFSFLGAPVAFGRRVCVNAFDEGVGAELHCTDAAGTRASLVVDLAPGTFEDPDLGEIPRSSFPLQLTAVGDRLFFVPGEQPLSGLWVTDGTALGTRRLGVSAPEVTHPEALARVGDRLFFFELAEDRSLSLWISEGDEASTRRVLQLAPDWVETRVAAVAEFRGRLAFVLDTLQDRAELWMSDGTALGTRPVAVVPWPEGGFFAESPGLVAAGDDLYFIGADEATGHELWASDGTAPGTRRVADLVSGPEGSSPLWLRPAGSVVLFSATDGATGHEPWVSDGTAEGTRRLADLVPGAGSSAPSGFVVLDHQVLFAAASPEAGREPWALDRAAISRRCTPGGERLCLGDGRYQVVVDWLDQRTGRSGRATPRPYSDDTGLLWFFRDDNLELFLKVLDGSTVNGHAWVFYGSLTDVAYWLTVTDLETGASRTYAPGPGKSCGEADTLAFALPATGGAMAGAANAAGPEATGAGALDAGMVDGAPCPGDPNALCFFDGRFEARVAWRDQRRPGREGVGTPVAVEARSGAFWFFRPGNLELVLKVLDGRPVNGKFWVFYGSLTDVEFDLTVTDTSTGMSKTYHNDPGELCGRSDTGAF